MDQLAPALATARAVHMVATLSLAGALSFQLLIAPYPLTRVVRPSLVVALLGGLAWLVLQAAAIAGADTVSDTLAAIVPVVQHTRFGHVLLLRLVLLLAAGALAWRGEGRARLIPAALIAGLAVMLQAALGHAAASEDPVLEASLAVHLLAASVWLGGLLPLWVALGAPGGEAAARRFSLLGIVAVGAIAATAFEQGAALFGGVAGMVGTPYGRVALVKLSLFSTLLVLATINRLVFTPALEQSRIATRRMQASVVAEVALGLMVILAASTLASLPPGVHEQPVWPFPARLNLDVFADPDLVREVTQGLCMLALGLALVGLGFIRRRLRLPAFVLGAGLAAFSVPHLDLLLVPAYPTSYYTSPTGFDAVGIAHGAELFAQNCVSCHGADGRGDGPRAKGMDIPPADLTAAHLWDHADGELFWWLTHGMVSPRGGLAMPGFGGKLDEDQIWTLIDFIRAHNAGLALDAAGTWPHPVQAPGLVADCGDGRMVALADLRGQVVRIVVGPPEPSPLLPTIFLDPGPPKAGSCVAMAPEIRTAYAVVAGVAPDALAGMSFLVDVNGWLRERLLAGSPAPTATSLAAAVKRFAAEPLSAASAERHH
jgi:putative copper export protein/mono/diheme cytochrome c family protein